MGRPASDDQAHVPEADPQSLLWVGAGVEMPVEPTASRKPHLDQPIAHRRSLPPPHRVPPDRVCRPHHSGTGAPISV